MRNIPATKCVSDFTNPLATDGMSEQNKMPANKIRLPTFTLISSLCLTKRKNI